MESLLQRAADLLGREQLGRAIVFGSTPMSLAGLPREPRDLDLFVASDLYRTLMDEGLEERRDAQGHPFLALAPDIEVWASFPGVRWDEVAARARLDPRARGLRVADLSHVRAYKIALGRSRDQADVRAIDALLSAVD